MAANLAVDDILRCTLVLKDSEQIVENVFHYLITAVSSPVPATDQDFGDNIDSIMAPLYKPAMANLSTYRGFLTQKIWPLPVTASVISNANAGVGTLGATPQPRQVCGLTSWYTALAGHKQRGRTYWGFPASNLDSGNGVVSAAGIALYAALGSALQNLTAVVAGPRSCSCKFVLYHRGDHTNTTITSKITRSEWATQRRRGSFGRANVSPV